MNKEEKKEFKDNDDCYEEGNSLRHSSVKLSLNSEGKSNLDEFNINDSKVDYNKNVEVQSAEEYEAEVLQRKLDKQNKLNNE